MQDALEFDGNIGAFKTWRGILVRCSPSGKYARSGINIHPNWRNSFSAFFAEVGPKPTPDHSIDRIDNMRGYEPGNVRWATKEQQKANRLSAYSVAYRGEQVALSIMAERVGLTPSRLHSRLQRGWSVEEAIGAVGRAHRCAERSREPSPRQKELLTVLRQYLATHGFSPTVREICAALNIGSTNAVSDILRALRKKGLVDWEDGHARTLRLVPAAVAT